MKKFTVKNYKGNLLESTKKFLESHKDMKIVEAIEDGGSLNIMAEPLPPIDNTAVATPEQNDVGQTSDPLLTFGSKLLLFGVESHLWHLNCRKNSQHLALKELYEACDDVGDRLLESRIGSTGKPAEFAFSNIDPTFTEASIDKIDAIKEEAAALNGFGGAGVDNILGEFCETCDSIVYKLKRLD